jgi:hypothetical protein
MSKGIMDKSTSTSTVGHIGNSVGAYEAHIRPTHIARDTFGDSQNSMMMIIVSVMFGGCVHGSLSTAMSITLSRMMETAGGTMTELAQSSMSVVMVVIKGILTKVDFIERKDVDVNIIVVSTPGSVIIGSEGDVATRIVVSMVSRIAESMVSFGSSAVGAWCEWFMYSTRSRWAAL